MPAAGLSWSGPNSGQDGPRSPRTAERAVPQDLPAEVRFLAGVRGRLDPEVRSFVRYMRTLRFLPFSHTSRVSRLRALPRPNRQACVKRYEDVPLPERSRILGGGRYLYMLLDTDFPPWRVAKLQFRDRAIHRP